MQRTSAQGLTFVNADMRGGADMLRIVANRIASVGAEAEPGDLIIDLHGDRLLPGLINAHDHLQLNNLGRLKYRTHYTNIRDWISDVSTHTRTDPELKACSEAARDQRLLLGGLKNILSGVTTVAHHDPLYDYLVSDEYPLSVLQHYGWSHSLLIDGEEEIRQAYRRTPGDWPWIIHAAEGVDDEAGAEFERLDALGCVSSNTVIVHGVAISPAQKQRLVQAGGALIWCPSSNLHLFDTTADVRDLVEQGRVALGTDSRLTGSRDLLSELRVARDVSGLDEETLEGLVTTSSARLLRLADRGVLSRGAVADILVLPQIPLATVTRADVRLLMIRGSVMYADSHYACAFAPASHWAQVSVDGRPKVIDRRLAGLLLRSDTQEPGFDASHAAWRAA